MVSTTVYKELIGGGMAAPEPSAWMCGLFSNVHDAERLVRICQRLAPREVASWLQGSGAVRGPSATVLAALSESDSEEEEDSTVIPGEDTAAPHASAAEQRPEAPARSAPQRLNAMLESKLEEVSWSALDVVTDCAPRELCGGVAAGTIPLLCAQDAFLAHQAVSIVRCLRTPTPEEEDALLRVVEQLRRWFLSRCASLVATTRVAPLDSTSEKPYVAFVMQRYEGPELSLSTMLSDGGCLTLSECIVALHDIGVALLELHTLGDCHGAVSLENVRVNAARDAFRLWPARHFVMAPACDAQRCAPSADSSSVDASADAQAFAALCATLVDTVRGSTATGGELESSTQHALAQLAEVAIEVAQEDGLLTAVRRVTILRCVVTCFLFLIPHFLSTLLLPSVGKRWSAALVMT